MILLGVAAEGHNMPRALRIAAHAGIFLVAALVFYVGLGVGLAVNPAGGTALWLLAAAIAVANVWWMVSGFRRAPKDRPG